MNQTRRKRKLRRPPRLLYPRYLENEYRRLIILYVRQMEDTTRTMLLPHLPEIESRVRMERPGMTQRTDAWPDDVGTLVEDLTGAFGELSKPIVRRVEGVATAVNRWNYKKWTSAVKTVMGVQVFVREPWLNAELDSFTKANVSLISKLTADTAADIQRVVQSGFREGKRAETIQQELMKGTKLKAGVFRNIENRAKVIARDQVGKLSGNLNHLRQTGLGIHRYVWRTALDERVRPSHKIMDGRLCSWDDSGVYYPTPESDPVPRPAGAVMLHPGEDYQCRCYGEPWFEDVAEELQIYEGELTE